MHHFFFCLSPGFFFFAFFERFSTIEGVVTKEKNSTDGSTPRLSLWGSNLRDQTELRFTLSLIEDQHQSCGGQAMWEARDSDERFDIMEKIFGRHVHRESHT